MISFASIASAVASVPAGTWIDVLCLAVVIFLGIVDSMRGFSTTLSALLGLLVAAHAGYWFYPIIASVMSGMPFCRNHATIGALLPYIFAIGIGLLIYITIRITFKKFFKLLVEQPMDRILGAIAGIVKGLLVIFLLFSCVSLFPSDTKIHRVFCDQSRTGRIVVPAVRSVVLDKVTNTAPKSFIKTQKKNKKKSS